MVVKVAHRGLVQFAFTLACQSRDVETHDIAVADLEAPASPDEFDVDPPFDPAESALPHDRFLDRELSWIAFNARVLELAQDDALPLLERVRFAAIFASNLDEFFMVRIAGLKRRIAAGVAVPSASGLNPRDVLSRSLAASQELMVGTPRRTTASSCPPSPPTASSSCTGTRCGRPSRSRSARSTAIASSRS